MSFITAFAIIGWVLFLAEKTERRIPIGTYHDSMGRRYKVASVDPIFDVVRYDVEFRNDVTTPSGVSSTYHHERIICSRKCFIKLGLKSQSANS